MKVYIGCDHGGVYLKAAVKEHLTEEHIEFEDLGVHETVSTDYGPIAKRVAELVVGDVEALGILICGTGIGMSIMANKVNGARAAVVHDTFSAAATRGHNDSNILCMGERVIGPGLAIDVVKTWLSTTFEGGRHQRRVDYINNYEIKA
ncbi:ribose 5-phosphate isomerase B [Halolactibacillus alkaliphilus]|uniref:Ribose 5-phosphate isomerase B n=1 Tax=Halolactibacillus alkaliphilus TaxID=442899 RepID=A0A511X3B5_9BACI|nr:ribose 5-phosphate isomerase B [Halolactibacillus alkaliphilus]GEN57437.1 ribose 5-phosphate isomerase B [Halolactibacillus alkaliphilus]GGN68444.1 ribose 5-phosphate isomerase B [Halolactibacillus alkaliphilus]SFO94979.1 ribose 5-phosphate isomerase B [Halolactibacillus alkaliphilus]